MIILRSGHRAVRAASAALAAAVALGGPAGCGQEEDPAGTLGGFYSMVQQHECRLALECCTELELGEITGDSMAQVRDCAENLQDVSVPVEMTYGPSLDRGWAVFDSAVALACLDALQAATCEQVGLPGRHARSGVCEDPLIPQQGPGDPCRLGLECTTGYCERGPGATEGLCVPPPGEGEACRNDCAEGYYCASDGTCVAVLADGASCWSDLECGSLTCVQPAVGAATVCATICDGL